MSCKSPYREALFICKRSFTAHVIWSHNISFYSLFLHSNDECDSYTSQGTLLSLLTGPTWCQLLLSTCKKLTSTSTYRKMSAVTYPHLSLYCTGFDFFISYKIKCSTFSSEAQHCVSVSIYGLCTAV